MLDEFEITCSSTSKPRRLAAFHQMLYETQQQGGTSVLLIDEAHLMSVELLEEVRLLGNTDTYQEKLVQIVLCGQPELFTVLQRPELRALQQRIAATCQLRALSLPETRAYIAERLHAAGLRGPVPFSSIAIESIHKLSGGVPRLINLLCDACLALGFETQKKQIDQSVVDQAGEELPGLSRPAVVFSVSQLSKDESHSSTNAVAEGVTTTVASQPRSNFVHAEKAVATVQESPEPPVVIIPPLDGNWTKSTFDVLIAALKQGRASARE